MKNLKELVVSALIALAISYLFVILFLGFGPVFIDGELAIYKIYSFTAVAFCVIFWPVHLLRRRRSRKR
ncbi:hypothetical protein PWP89_06070 [Stenotrophomonas rhizophila]|jgi:hypothetical protein|uniref:hypothetical protein n=1 Tax=Stenotrophomonas rhizophila TaxID=216778 RepID=UPI000B8337DD